MRSLDVVIPSLVILVLSLSFHEAAHAWTADRLGDRTARVLGRLTLNPLAHIDWIGTVLFPLIAMTTGAPLFGWAKPVPVRMAALRSPRRDFAMVAIAGPLSNLLLALVAALCLAPLSHAEMAPPWHDTAIGILVQAVEMNVLLAVFNMIPVPPLDGANVLAGFVPEGVAHLIDRIRPYGFLVLYALLFTGVLGAIAWPIEDTIVRWLL